MAATNCSRSSWSTSAISWLAVALSIQPRSIQAARPAGEPAFIADYRIVAPTEWNFHPQGVFVREALATPPMPAADRQRRLRALALALDPCVAVSWQVEENGDA